MLVGALPWDAGHAKQVPSDNTNCGAECFFPQKIAEHPFMFDRFGHQKGAAAPKVTLTQRSKDLLRGLDWFWVVTGVHQGGGLDCAMIIRKKGPSLGAHSAPLSAALGLPLGATVEKGSLEGAKHQLDMAVQQQAELQTRQTEITSKLQSAGQDASSLAASREADCRDRLERAGATAGIGDSLVYALLVLSVCFNLLLLSRQRKAEGYSR